MLRFDLQDLEPYDPKIKKTKINLSANENCYSDSSEFKSRILNKLSEVDWNRYPNPTADGLRNTLAKHFNLEKNNFVVGNGGDELIFNTILAFGGPKGKLVNTPPTFSIYALGAKLLMTPVVDVERDSDTFEINLEKLVQASKDASIVVITSPNNPTGNMMSRREIETLLKSTEAVVLVDEAYIDFANPDNSCVELIHEYKNLAVLRTLSKAYGLAGLRLGYIIANPELIDCYLSVRQPYSVNSFTQVVGEEVFKDANRVQEYAKNIALERDKMFNALVSLEQNNVIDKVWPSKANFHLIRIDKDPNNASKVASFLADESSILIRDFSKTKGLEGCLRITIGTPDENKAVLLALENACKKL